MMIDTISQCLGDRLPACLPDPGRRFLANIIKGKVEPLGPAELDALVRACLSGKLLASLSSDEISLLEQDLFARFSGNYGHAGERWPALAGTSCFLWRGSGRELVEQYKGSADYHTLFLGEHAGKVRAQAALASVTPAEKEVLFTAPEIWTFLQLIGAWPHTLPALQNGTRHLVADHNREARGQRFFSPAHYGFTRESFSELLRQIRSTQNKKGAAARLRGLDIGGSNGLAAYEAECLDAEIDFTSTTLDLEPAFWPLRGGHVFCSGEALPASFRERFDLVLSLVAFHWMRYPHIALKNVIDSLACGGIAYIEFTIDRQRIETDGPLLAGVRQIYEHLKTLEHRGQLELLPRPEHNPAIIRLRKTGAS
jgi:SAM-dependent methyltransferase